MEVLLCGYREVDDGPYDALAGMEVTRRLGRGEPASYGRRLHALLRSGGLLPAHDVYAAKAHRARQDEAFVHRYVTPRLRVRTLAGGLRCLNDAGLKVLAAENLIGPFGPTFRAWPANPEAHRDRAVAAEGARAWQFFLADGALACERHWTGAARIVATRLPRPRAAASWWTGSVRVACGASSRRAPAGGQAAAEAQHTHLAGPPPPPPGATAWAVVPARSSAGHLRRLPFHGRRRGAAAHPVLRRAGQGPVGSRGERTGPDRSVSDGAVTPVQEDRGSCRRPFPRS
ncbi:hypothetical protein GCM10010389_49150 [Streptomyces echinoruber]|uniref:Uncharacterized protein n=1 Tax=Streptomyces echinoruber TaxID=68898 RepID=A0A918RMG8_9ACTN|nr:hypothetical protein GCM10010389_49150 [Streptomyces echinoruber]